MGVLLWRAITRQRNGTKSTRYEWNSYRIIGDIRDHISSLDEFCARPIQRGEHPTLHMDDSQGKIYNNTGISISKEN